MLLLTSWESIGRTCIACWRVRKKNEQPQQKIRCISLFGALDFCVIQISLNKTSLNISDSVKGFENVRKQNRAKETNLLTKTAFLVPPTTVQKEIYSLYKAVRLTRLTASHFIMVELSRVRWSAPHHARRGKSIQRYSFTRKNK